MCEIPLTYIAKLETSNRDKANLFHRLGFNLPPRHITIKKNTGPYKRVCLKA